MLWTPRPYQPIARDFIIDTPRCNLWLDMGMGKTVSTLTALDILWLAGSRYWPALVIAPKRVARDTWAPEAAKWEHLKHLRVSAIIGDRKQRCAAAVRKADVYTINYENIPWLVEFFGRKKWPFRIVISDESRKLASFRIRHGGIRAAALSKVAKLTGRWVNLTGTPAPEGLKDLWGPQWFVDFGSSLGFSHGAFAERWFYKTEFGLEARAAAEREIMDLIAPTTLSMRAKDWIEGYYEPTPRPVYFDLPPKARKIYDDMEVEMFAELDSLTEVEAMNSGSKYGKCSQIASGAIYTDPETKAWEVIHDKKLDCLGEILDELCGDPLLVVYHFKHDLARIQKRYPYMKLYESEQDMHDWNAGKFRGMLVHAASAGHGLNFQDGGCNIAFFSQVPSLELRQQVIERLGPVRQIQAGHPRPVLVWDIIARNTVNEVDYARADTKARRQDAMREYRDRKRR